MEGERLPIMDSWKSYASLVLSAFAVIVVLNYLISQRVREKAFCGARLLACFCDGEFMF